jgi:sugar O-acyltransferase (sialic acid O-acetyltransferase NeuD family)
MARIRLLIVGAGGHGRAVGEAAVLSGRFDIAGFLDDLLPVGATIAGGGNLLGPLCSMGNLLAIADRAIVAIGDNILREKLTRQLVLAGFTCETIIHPKAIVSPTAVLGAGCSVMAGAILGTEARLGIGVIVNCGAVVDHHAVVEDFGHLGVNSSMAGGALLGKGAWLQPGSALGYGVKTPPSATLAPGVVVDFNGGLRHP